MELSIITPEATLFEGEVESVKLQGVDGKFQILNNHAPIISALAQGRIIIRGKDKTETEFEINGGLLEMSENRIQILAQ